MTGLRIVAAAWVVFFHFHFTPLPGVAEVVALVGPLLTAGALGVDLFFVLSGFVIAYTYLDQLGPALRADATARFVWARACRLWPAYALVFHVFGLWLAARLVFGSIPRSPSRRCSRSSVEEYLQQLVMVQLWDNPFFDGASWVGPRGRFSAEWLAYLLFPVAALGFFRLRNAARVGAGQCCRSRRCPRSRAPTCRRAARTTRGAGWSASPAGSAPGCWPAWRCAGCAPGRPVVRVGRGSLLAARCRAIAVGLLAGELLGPGRGGAVIVLFPLLVGALALADRGPALVLSRPWAVYGGALSYCLYLVHIPMFELYWSALQTSARWGRTRCWPTSRAWPCSSRRSGWPPCAFRCVEEPARRRLLRVRRPGRHQLPVGMRVPPLDGVHGAPRHALVLAGHHRPAHRAA